MSGMAPAACLWTSGIDWLGRIDPATHQLQSWQLPGVATVATADDACRVWAATSSSLLKIDATGARLASQPLNEPVTVLATNPHSGEVTALGKTTLYHFASNGTLLSSLAVDGKPLSLSVDQDETLWLLTDKALLHYARPVSGSSPLALLSSLAVKADAFAVDNLGNQLWLAQNKTLTRYRLPDLALLGSTQMVEQAIALTLDPLSGDLYSAGKKTWQHLNCSGQPLASADLKALNLDVITMAWDAATASVWLAHKTGFAQLSATGQMLGNVSATAPSALSAPPFKIQPLLELIAPGADIVTNQTRPTFIVRKTAQCNGQPCSPASYALNPAAKLDNTSVTLTADIDLERLRYTPTGLAEGAHVFTATLTDRFGHSAATITSRVNIDTTPPLFTSLAPADGTLFWFADTAIEGAVNEAGSLVTLTPGYQSGMSPFRFAVSLNPGSNPYTITALDRAGNTAGQGLTLRYQPIEVQIDSPVANASINDDLVNVSGRLIAPTGTTVNVNGKAVVLAGSGANETSPVGFSLGNLPLDPGQNTITATATLPAGQTVQKTVPVTSTLTGPATASWSLEPATPGQYKVLVKWPQATGLASNASYTVSHAQGQTAVTLDQRQNGNTWQPLGTFELAPGQSHKVALIDRADGTVVADAVRMEWVGGTMTAGGGTGTGGTGTQTQGEAEIFYVHPDHLGTPRVITNEAKQIVWRWDNSEPFGNNKPNEDADGDGKTLTYNHRFPGQYFDEETGLHYNYFRDYDPSTGRYPQADPIGLAGGLNVYEYANAAPTTYTDPEGLTPGTATGAAIGTAIAPGPGTVIGALVGTGVQALVGGAAMAAMMSIPGDSSSNSSRAVPYPDRKRGRYTCICRANKDGRSPDNCSTDSQEFAMGYGEGSTLTEAKRAAEKDAKEKLGAKSTHHVQCRCRDPKGDPIIPTR
jgi:RHS repeat-associated protein